MAPCSTDSLWYRFLPVVWNVNGLVYDVVEMVVVKIHEGQTPIDCSLMQQPRSK